MNESDFFGNPRLFGHGCVLTALGARFDPEAFLSRTSFDSEVVLWHGKMGFPERFRIKVAESVGEQAAALIDAAHLVLSISDSGVSSVQHERAMEFFRRHREEILRLSAFPNVEQVNLRCAVADGEVYEALPEELIDAAVQCGITSIM